MASLTGYHREMVDKEGKRAWKALNNPPKDRSPKSVISGLNFPKSKKKEKMRLTPFRANYSTTRIHCDVWDTRSSRSSISGWCLPFSNECLDRAIETDSYNHMFVMHTSYDGLKSLWFFLTEDHPFFNLPLLFDISNLNPGWNNVTCPSALCDRITHGLVRKLSEYKP